MKKKKTETAKLKYISKKRKKGKQYEKPNSVNIEISGRVITTYGYGSIRTFTSIDIMPQAFYTEFQYEIENEYIDKGLQKAKDERFSYGLNKNRTKVYKNGKFSKELTEYFKYLQSRGITIKENFKYISKKELELKIRGWLSLAINPFIKIYSIQDESLWIEFIKTNIYSDRIQGCEDALKYGREYLEPALKSGIKKPY